MAFGPEVDTMALDATIQDVSQGDITLTDLIGGPAANAQRCAFDLETGQWRCGAQTGHGRWNTQQVLALRNAYQHIAHGDPAIALNEWSQPGVQPAGAQRGLPTWAMWTIGGLATVAVVGGGIWLARR